MADLRRNQTQPKTRSTDIIGPGAHLCGNTTQHNPQRPTRNLAKRGCLDVPRMPEERRFADAVISATTIVPTPDKRRDFSLKTAQLPEQVAGRATSAVGSFSCYAVSKARKPRSQSSMCLAPGNKSRPGSKVQPRSSWTLRSSSLNCFRACIDPKGFFKQDCQVLTTRTFNCIAKQRRAPDLSAQSIFVKTLRP